MNTLTFRTNSLYPISNHVGFTLIELMISMTIGLILMTTIITIYVNIGRTNTDMTNNNIQIENARVAIQLLQTDLAHAGFWLSYVPNFDDLTYTSIPTDFPTAIPDPCVSYTPPIATATLNNLFGIAVQAYDAVPTECSSSGTGPSKNLITNKQADTDVLVVRHANTCAAGEEGCEKYLAGNDKLYFQSSLNFGGYCLPPTVNDAVAFILSNSAATLDLLHEKDCSTLITEKRKFISNIYWIRNYEVTSGDGIPTLMRSQFDFQTGYGLAHHPTEIESLVGGIEGFRVELGIDSKSDTGAAVAYTTKILWADPLTKLSPTNRGDGIPDGDFIHCSTATPCTIDQLINVVAVKLYLLVRTRDKIPNYTDTKIYDLGSTSVGPKNDNYKRHVYAITVRLHNIAARRETP